MTPIRKVAGIGPALAGFLAAKSILTAEELAKASPETLQSIPRLGAQRALGLIAAAKKIVSGAETDQTAAKPKKSAKKYAGKVKKSASKKAAKKSSEKAAKAASDKKTKSKKAKEKKADQAAKTKTKKAAKVKGAKTKKTKNKAQSKKK